MASIEGPQDSIDRGKHGGSCINGDSSVTSERKKKQLLIYITEKSSRLV